MSKYEYYQQEGMQAVARDSDGIVISIGNQTPVELTKEQFKVIQDKPNDFAKKFQTVKGKNNITAKEKSNVNKNE